MGPKCCVGGCNTTSGTHRLFRFPKNDNLRSLWMFFVVPTNSQLILLTKDQLLTRSVCERHFDRLQFDAEGRRLRYSYPSLFTEEEIARGEPLGPLPTSGNIYNFLSEHNYAKSQYIDDDESDETQPVIGRPGEDYHEHPSCSSAQSTAVNVKSVVMEPEVIETSTLIQKRTHQDTVTPETTILPHQRRRRSLQAGKGSASKRILQKRKFFKQCKKYTEKNLEKQGMQRIKEAEKFIHSKKLFDNFNLLNKQAQTFLLMQLRNCRKNKKARRFTLEEKLNSLLLLKQSPKEYRLLEHLFSMPSKRTLHRLAEKICVEPGLNPQIFQFIKNKIRNWNLEEKLCTIVFDEVSLTPHLTFNEKTDQILGLVDIAGERQQKLCDHALIFMVRGVCASWRQSVAFYFCEGTVPAPSLQNILKNLLVEVVKAGLIPLGLVCDQGSTFRTAIKKLREDTVRSRNSQGLPDDGTIRIGDCNLNVFYDPPHLLKGIRNNFLNKDIIWEGKVATWKDIQFVYDLDNKLGETRNLPKLTAHHVDPDKIKKMKVSVAAQVLSTRTAAMLKYTNAKNQVHGKEDTMNTTAEVVEFFDKLFDSVNGSPGGMKKGKLRKAVKINSAHKPFWTEAIKKLKKLMFVDIDSKIAKHSGKSRLVRVPSLEGWITTLESFIRLSKHLFEKYSLEFFYPRYINQDPLENFFGRIRALNYRNVNPDCNAFIYAFKSLLLTSMLNYHSKFANCEEDDGDSILDVSFLFKQKITRIEGEENKENEPPTAHISAPQPSVSLTKEEVVMEKIKVQSSAYTAGYVCRKMNQHINCKSCLLTNTSRSIDATGIHAFIKYREYETLKNDNLVYPNENLLRAYRIISKKIHTFLDKYCYKKQISKKLTNIIVKTVDLSWLGCQNHHATVTNVFIKTLLRLQVHNWCNIINKILKGALGEKYISKMEIMKNMAFRKYKTYILRKKVLIK